MEYNKKNKKDLITITFVIMLIITGVFSYNKYIVNIDVKANEEFELKDESLSITLGEFGLIEIIKVDNETYTYESSDTNVATVDSNGRVRTIMPGITIIKVTSSTGIIKECTVEVLPIVEKIEVNLTDINLKEKEEKIIEYEILPSKAKVNSIEWKSSDTNVAVVDQYGKITAISSGKAVIEVAVNEFVINRINVSVYGDPISVKLDKTTNTIKKGEFFTLKGTISPILVEDNTLKWSSSDTNIASVDSKGKVIGKNVGTATITVSTSNGKTDQCKVEVKPIEVESIILNNTKVTTIKSNSVQLLATIKPSNATDKRIMWESSDTSIATVTESGKVIPKKVGTVTITAITSNNKKSTAVVTIKNNTYNKTAIFFGDSITEGAGSEPSGYSWANYIGEHYDLKSTTNAGKSGWLISSAVSSKWISSNVKSYSNKKYDYVILHGGTNDISRAVKLGTYSPNDFSGNYDTSTFLGGLEYYIYLAKKQWPTAKIGYIINYETPLSSENRVKLSASYYEGMKKVLNKWGIKYLDLYFGKTSSGQSYSDLLKVNSKIYLPDALHLNNEGYKLISPYIYNFMNTL